jgi:hypothetical protein
MFNSFGGCKKSLSYLYGSAWSSSSSCATSFMFNNKDKNVDEYGTPANGGGLWGKSGSQLLFEVDRTLYGHLSQVVLNR